MKELYRVLCFDPFYNVDLCDGLSFDGVMAARMPITVSFLIALEFIRPTAQRCQQCQVWVVVPVYTGILHTVSKDT
jgi:hypothetical protein